MRTITLIPGDGIGPDVTNAAVRVIEATGVKISYEKVDAGMSALSKSGHPLPARTIDSIRRNKVVLKGPLGTPIGEGFTSVNVQLRKIFNLHLNFRPIKSVEGVKGIHKGVDLLVCRENTEELYTGEEDYIFDPVSREIIGAQVIGRITYVGSRRFFESVFQLARSMGRKKVTVLHKANILKLTNGLFLEVGKEIAARYPEIHFEERIVDAGSMWVVMDPSQFDVIATTNLFGDILSDVFAGLVGGLGLIPAANIGTEYSIFEAVHGTWPAAAGKNLANPTAVILSSAMMLDHINEKTAGELIRRAVLKVIAEGKKVTKDIDRDAGVGTAEMTDEIIYTITDLARGA